MTTYNSRILTEPIQGKPAIDPEAKIALYIIKQARDDARHGMIDTEFFTSDWYENLLAYLSYSFPHFNPDGRVFPQGVVVKEWEIVVR